MSSVRIVKRLINNAVLPTENSESPIIVGSSIKPKKATGKTFVYLTYNKDTGLYTLEKSIYTVGTVTEIHRLEEGIPITGRSQPTFNFANIEAFETTENSEFKKIIVPLDTIAVEPSSVPSSFGGGKRRSRRTRTIKHKRRRIHRRRTTVKNLITPLQRRGAN